MPDLERPAPPAARPLRRDWVASAIVAASVLLHAGAITTFVLTHRAEAKPPTEIPVEIVQLPPEPAKPEPPKAASKPPAPETPKPQAQKAAPEPTKAEQPKPEQPKPEQKKPEQPKPEQKKAEQPKPEPRKSPPKQSAKAAPRHTEPKQAQASKPEPPNKSVAERMEQLIGPMPAMAMPAMAAGEGSALDDSVPYRQLVLSRVAKQKREGRHEGIPGHVAVAFSIGDSGEVLTCEVLEKSGDPSLDAEAVAMVQRGAPYPPPPPGAMRDFSFGLTFQVM